MTTIERLEKWNGGHKARSVSIEVDDGYGATCWRVTLTGEKLPGDPERGTDDEPNPAKDYAGWRKKFRTVIEAAECSFWGFPPDMPVEEQKKQIPPTVVYVCPPWEAEKMEDWPGLDKTIHAAIDRWELLTNNPAAAG